MLHRLKIPYKRCRLDFKRTTGCPRGNSRGDVGPLGVGWRMVALSDTPWSTSNRAPARGSSDDYDKMLPLKNSSKEEGGGLCICLFLEASHTARLFPL